MSQPIKDLSVEHKHWFRKQTDQKQIRGAITAQTICNRNVEREGGDPTGQMN